MAIGVAVANAILLIIFAEEHRRAGTRQFASIRGGANAHETHLDDQYGHDRRNDSMALGLGEGAQTDGASRTGRDRGIVVCYRRTLLVCLWCFPWFRSELE